MKWGHLLITLGAAFLSDPAAARQEPPGNALPVIIWPASEKAKQDGSVSCEGYRGVTLGETTAGESLH